jgi:hypothetical protein
MKLPVALLLLATLVSCAGPVPQPPDEAAVVEPGVACRVSRDGGPTLAERGTGGTGAPAKGRVADGRVADRGIGGTGIGGTGIIGVVTGFASICVDGVEVRFDRSVPVSIDGETATPAQLRIGQLVVIHAHGTVSMPDAVAKARTISVRYEVSGPIEAVDTSAGSITVAGQRVMVRPSTWVAGRFAVGNWTAVSGLRQSDGTIIASRLDPARAGALLVRGQLSRERDTTRIGGLVLHGPGVGTVKAGSFVLVEGRYDHGAVEVTAIDADVLSADPVGYFGPSTPELIIQAFVRIDGGTVWLSNGQNFRAEPTVPDGGRFYRNAILWLERKADGSFAATALRYTSYRAQPGEVKSTASRHKANGLALPPDAPPGPPAEASPTNAAPADTPASGATDGDTGTDAPAGATPDEDAPQSAGVAIFSVPAPTAPRADRGLIAAR